MDNTWLLTLYKELRPVLWVTRWQGCKAAGEQSRGWNGGSAEDRGAEDRGPEDSCAGQLCREAQRMAVQRDPEGRGVTSLLHEDLL